MTVETGKIYTDLETLQALCKYSKKFGLMVSFDTEPADGMSWDEYFPGIKSASNGRIDWDANEDQHQLVIEGLGWALFESEEDLYDAYYDFVGDDGPTKRNSYDGPIKIFAATCSDEGELWSENT